MTKKSAPNDLGNNNVSPTLTDMMWSNSRPTLASGTFTVVDLQRVIEATLAIIEDDDFSDNSSGHLLSGCRPPYQ